LPTKVVYQFPDPTWIENIGVRSNGVLLLDLITTPDIYMLDPDTQAARLIYTFPNALAVLGIAEVSPDVFAVAVGNFSTATKSTVKGSYSIWTVDFNSNIEEEGGNVNPTVTKAVDIPEAAFPNGLETLAKDQVLVADSSLGAVWKVDVSSGKYEIVIQVPEMSPSATAIPPIGINGLHLFNGYLYWTNSDANTLYRAKVDQGGCLVPGTRVEPLANSGTFMDDFIIDDGGNAWIATNTANLLLVVTADDKLITVDGSKYQLTVAGATACRFGRRQTDRKTLYVVTDGGLAAPVNGTVVEGGKVVAVDTSGFQI
jgi:sugar lactone lactonase YvrE